MECKLSVQKRVGLQEVEMCRISLSPAKHIIYIIYLRKVVSSDGAVVEDCLITIWKMCEVLGSILYVVIFLFFFEWLSKV